MVGKKQNYEFCGVTGLTEADLKIIKALTRWPYNTKLANSFNLAIDIGVSESNVGKRIRALRHRGLVGKSLGGSFYIQQHFKKRILEEFSVEKQEQRYLEAKEQPIDTPEEFDKALKIALENVDKNIEEQMQTKEDKQRSTNYQTRYKKRVDAKKYDEAKKRSKDGRTS